MCPAQYTRLHFTALITNCYGTGHVDVTVGNGGIAPRIPYHGARWRCNIGSHLQDCNRLRRLAPLLRIWEIWRSNLGPETGYSDRGFHVFFSVPRSTRQDNAWIRPRPLPYTPMTVHYLLFILSFDVTCIVWTTAMSLFGPPINTRRRRP